VRIHCRSAETCGHSSFHLARWHDLRVAHTGGLEALSQHEDFRVSGRRPLPRRRADDLEAGLDAPRGLQVRHLLDEAHHEAGNPTSQRTLRPAHGRRIQSEFALSIRSELAMLSPTHGSGKVLCVSKLSPLARREYLRKLPKLLRRRNGWRQFRLLRRLPLHGKVAPARRSFDADGYDRILDDQHGIKLRVSRAEQCLRVIVLNPTGQDFRAPM
jgi:hypothetical protein